jgi:hypothetical protein
MPNHSTYIVHPLLATWLLSILPSPCHTTSIPFCSPSWNLILTGHPLSYPLYPYLAPLQPPHLLPLHHPSPGIIHSHSKVMLYFPYMLVMCIVVWVLKCCLSGIMSKTLFQWRNKSFPPQFLSLITEEVSYSIYCTIIRINDHVVNY